MNTQIDYDDLVWGVSKRGYPRVVATCFGYRLSFDVKIQSCCFDTRQQKLESTYDLQQMLNDKRIPMWGPVKPVVKEGLILLWPNSGIEVTCSVVNKDDNKEDVGARHEFFKWFAEFVFTLYGANEISKDIDKACIKYMLAEAEAVNKTIDKKEVTENGNQDSNGSQEVVCDSDTQRGGGDAFRRRTSLVKNRDQNSKAGKEMNKGQVEYAVRQAHNLFDAWNDVAGVFEIGTGSYAEILSVIADSVHCGIQMATQGRIDIVGNEIVINKVAELETILAAQGQPQT